MQHVEQQQQPVQYIRLDVFLLLNALELALMTCSVVSEPPAAVWY